MAVMVLDRHKRPLMPCSEKRARLLLDRGRARVHRVRPFVIRLVDRRVDDSVTQPLRLKLDPGSRVTGLAVVREVSEGKIAVVTLMELKHRGKAIREALTARCAMRRRRRGKLRYRAPRFLNRSRRTGWLPPSLQHRVDTILSWVNRLRQWCPITAISSELVRFDLQKEQNPEIAGVEYQRGTLFGYEVREYLLEKWHHRCAYCNKGDLPLTIDHVIPRADGGSDRISNLVVACFTCNQAKSARPIEVFVKDAHKRESILRQIRAPLKDAAAVNTTRWALVHRLRETGLPVELASGGRTKFNRTRLMIPKTHALDAACVGRVESVSGWQQPTLVISAMGRGAYQRARLDRYGFPRGQMIRVKRIRGFATGDHVRADVPKGKKQGIHVGRVAVRATGSFNIGTTAGMIQGISYRYCQLVQRADGYGYSQHPTIATLEKEAA